MGDITKIKFDSHYIVRDIVVYIDDNKHLQRVIKSIKALEGIKLLRIIDEVQELHRGGKIKVNSRVPLRTIADLQKIYTPGVATICQKIIKSPGEFFKYTYANNTVAIVTNGTAVLGLGNIGTIASLPVMEGKSVLFEQLVGINGIPILVKSKNAEEIVKAVIKISDSFGAIQLEDISAPTCFQVEEKLQQQCTIPVFHDDQHGTAIVTLAALMNTLPMTDRKKEDARVLISGAGAAGIAIARILMAWGVKDIILCDRNGALEPQRKENMNQYKLDIALKTNPAGLKGKLSDLISGRDVFIGVSAPGLLTPEMVSQMNKRAIVFALANPIPEIWPGEALRAGAEISIDGRTLNNALAFPGIFRGALDAHATCVSETMKLAAARAIAQCAKKRELVPSVLDRNVHRRVAQAVKKAFLNHAESK